TCLTQYEYTVTVGARACQPAYSFRRMNPPRPLPDDLFDGLPPAAQASTRPLEPIAAQAAALTSLLAPARGQRFIFQAQVVKAGKSLTFCESRALAEDGTAEPRLVASMTATLMAIYDRPGITR